MDNAFIAQWAPWLAALAIWEIIWKGLGLWRAGRRNEPIWFVAILLVNSVGLLPIIYLVMTKAQSKPQETAE